MKENKKSTVLFDYDCGICGKTGGERCPVIFKPSWERIMICETCLSFIKDHGEYSSYEIIQKGKS